jgi:hypothetical protein
MMPSAGGRELSSTTSLEEVKSTKLAEREHLLPFQSPFLNQRPQPQPPQQLLAEQSPLLLELAPPQLEEPQVLKLSS